MVIERFPSVETADRSGLLALGGDLDWQTLHLAYSSGIFPWPVDGRLLAWFSPPRRAVLFCRDLHISRSLAKERKRTDYSYRFDYKFAEVIRACSQTVNRGNQNGTWITPEIIAAYCCLQRKGLAHSLACSDHGVLIGGLYGVSIGAMFAGESMFFRRSNASKLCLWHLVEHLNRKGVEWIDCQVMTPLFRSFGAKEIDRGEFIALLKKALRRNIPGLFRNPPGK